MSCQARGSRNNQLKEIRRGTAMYQNGPFQGGVDLCAPAGWLVSGRN